MQALFYEGDIQGIRIQNGFGFFKSNTGEKLWNSQDDDEWQLEDGWSHLMQEASRPDFSKTRAPWLALPSVSQSMVQRLTSVSPGKWSQMNIPSSVSEDLNLQDRGQGNPDECADCERLLWVILQGDKTVRASDACEQLMEIIR